MTRPVLLTLALAAALLAGCGGGAGPGRSGRAREAALGSQHHGLPGRDFVAVLEALVAAGNPVEPRFAEVAEGPLRDWLRDRPSP